MHSCEVILYVKMKFLELLKCNLVEFTILNFFQRSSFQLALSTYAWEEKEPKFLCKFDNLFQPILSIIAMHFHGLLDKVFNITAALQNFEALLCSPPPL